ncbi:Uncharacterised protein [Actinobacillus ureae]|nr:Uncharacterised protein [Actinobacillus ureae]
MKKVITLSAIIALSIATVAEAKRGSLSRSVTGKPIAAQKHNLFIQIRKKMRHLIIRKIVRSRINSLKQMVETV